MKNTNLTDVDIAKLVDVASRQPGFGGAGSATFNIFHGINAMGTMPTLPPNADNQGFTFFTKPALNLSYNNVTPVRKLAFLASSDRNSMASAIKCMLSPKGFDKIGDKGRSNVVDDRSAFLPISNLLMSLSPPPDLVADVYTSSEGYAKEQVSWIDAKPNDYRTYQLSATFANIEGDPITTIFSTWLEYAMRVREGTMLPFTLNIVENRIDYQTRIYRLTLDRSKKFVQHIFATGASFPTSNPIGAALGYTHGVHLSPEADQIRVEFQCMGAIYDDPILIMEFNLTTVLFNPDMADGRRDAAMVKVEGRTDSGIEQLSLFNYKMYPRISPTMELEWWVNKVEYTAVIALLKILQPDAVENKPPANVRIPTIDTSPWSKTVLKPGN